MKKIYKIFIICCCLCLTVSCKATVKKDGLKDFPENKDELVGYDDMGKRFRKLSFEIFEKIMNGRDMNVNCVVSTHSIHKLFDLISLTTDDKVGLEYLNNYKNMHLQNSDTEDLKSASIILINKEEIKDKSKNIEYRNIRTVENSKEATNVYQSFQKEFLEEVLDSKEINKKMEVALIDLTKFIGEWDKEFENADTTMKDFKTFDKNVIKVPMMKNLFENEMALSDDEKDIFILRTKNYSSVYFVKPKKKTNLNSEELNSYINDYFSKCEKYDVSFSVPKMDIKTDFDFKDTIKNLGLEKLITGFTMDKLLPNEILGVSTARQVSTLKLDEKGIKAKTSTVIVMEKSAVPVENKHIEINMDSPFYIVIEDIRGLVAHVGYIANPTK